MARGRRSNRRTRRAAPRRNPAAITDMYFCTVPSASTQALNRDTFPILKSMGDRPFRVAGISIEYSSPLPCLVQFRCYGPSMTDNINSSGVLMAGPQPRRRNLRSRGSWFPGNTAGSTTLAAIDVLRSDTVRAQTDVRATFVVRIRFFVAPPELQSR
ncbi:17 kDa protein [Olive viral satellite RNA]|uniref:17 kDa protein n=1 Tax=Olive viral satellite RNA TaxID=1250316 RepID=V5J7G1_9VIRU|nr:17 kDa protein [Olive viral satellite RNA]AGC79862.1 17 kDa protein [Olive viral satellite RNA]